MGSHPHIESKKVISVYTIETDRLILRPFREGDAADIFEYLKEPICCFVAAIRWIPY
jgi:hypothetical protein